MNVNNKDRWMSISQVFLGPHMMLFTFMDPTKGHHVMTLYHEEVRHRQVVRGLSHNGIKS